MTSPVFISALPAATSWGSGDYTLVSQQGGITKKIGISAIFTVGTPGYTPSGSNAAQFTGNSNSYYQISIQNTNTGTSASSDFVATSDTGNDVTHYADFGINNSIGGTTPFPNPYSGYLYVTDSELDFGVLGNAGVINFYATGGMTAPYYVGSINSTGLNNMAIGNATPSTGKFTTLSASGNVTGSQLVSTISGQPPLVVGSTSQVANLNAQYLGGYLPSSFANVTLPNTWMQTQTFADGGAWSSTGILTTYADIGNMGTEGSSILLNGATYTAVLKASDIGAMNPVQEILHRHSTSLEPIFMGARSNSDTSAHANVTNGQNVLTFMGSGYAGTNGYEQFASINFAVSSTGSISNSSSPGAIKFNTTPNGNNFPVTAVTIDQDQSVTLSGAFKLPGGTFSIGGNTTFSGAYTFTGTVTNNTTVTFPTTGTLLTTTGSGSSLTFGTGSLSLAGNLTTSGAYNIGFTMPGAYTYTFPSSTSTLAILGANTFTGKQTTVASASGAAGLNLPPGAAPSAPVNGDIWTTTAGIYVQINGGTVGPLSAGGSAITALTGDVTASGSGSVAAALALTPQTELISLWLR